MEMLQKKLLKNKYMNEIQLKKYMNATNYTGVRFGTVEIRKWWNPLRYIIGKIYYKKI